MSVLVGPNKPHLSRSITPSPSSHTPASRSASTPVSRPRSAETAARSRCRAAGCISARNALAEEVKAHAVTTRKLEMLTRQFKREVEGGVRKWDAEVGDDLRRELEVSKECSYQASRNSKCALEKSKKLAAERLQLLDDKLQLAREVTALKGAIASEAKKYVRLPHHAPAPRTVLNNPQSIFNMQHYNQWCGACL